jgi:imidazolonepropionase-like amidohydrolase
MRPLDAMIAATANGARALRLLDTGRIEEGLKADLVLWDANPVEDPTTLRDARAVWRGGARIPRTLR